MDQIDKCLLGENDTRRKEGLKPFTRDQYLDRIGKYKVLRQDDFFPPSYPMLCMEVRYMAYCYREEIAGRQINISWDQYRIIATWEKFKEGVN